MNVEKLLMTVLYSTLFTALVALLGVLAVKFFPLSIVLAAVFAAAFARIWRYFEE